MPRKTPRYKKYKAVVVLRDAEKIGKDFGLGKGVVAVYRVTAPTDPTAAAVALMNLEKSLIDKTVRIDWSENG